MKGSRLLLLLSALVVAFAFSRADGVDYAFTTVDDPLASAGTYPNGGTSITGYYGGAVVGDYYANSTENGFYEVGGIYTTIDYPTAPAGNTTVTGVYGTTAIGYYSDANGFVQSFTENGGVYTLLPNAPNARQTYALGTYGNTIVGAYTAGQSSPGFTETGGVLTTLNFPGSFVTEATGIWGSTIVGLYVTDSASGFLEQGFSESGGIFTTISDPNATGFTEVNGIYGNTLFGEYQDSTGDHAFSETNGIFSDESLEVPGATSTAAYEVYGSTIVGNYGDSIGTHGFIATPVPEPTNTLPLITLVAFAMVARRARKSYRLEKDGTSRTPLT